MSFAMSIVLPGRQKKKSDIFAPSKSIQDAKEKIGPAYFDITLLECSRNAVELTKLISRWEKLEKENVKVIREIKREENLLLRSLKAHRSETNKLDDKDKKTKSVEGIETLDGKIVPPGFRFTANGNIKPSSLAQPRVVISDTGNEEIVEVGFLDGSSTRTVKRPDSYSKVNGYEEEIKELEHVINDIHKDLSKYKTGADRFPSSEKFKTYLRAHSNEFVSAPSEHRHEQIFDSPNDRFAFKPGSSAKLYKQELKMPSHRSCIGCKFKLMCDVSETPKITNTHSADLGKRRWSYVPHGKYVQSTSSLFPKVSNTRMCKSTSQNVSIIDNKDSKSVVHFSSQTEDMAKTTKSLDRMKLTSYNGKGCLKNTQSQSPSLSARSKRSLNTISTQGRSLSSVSGLSGFSSGRSSAYLLIDHESKMRRMKKLQNLEQHHCDEKVRAFINKLDSDNKQATKNPI